MRRSATDTAPVTTTTDTAPVTTMTDTAPVTTMTDTAPVTTMTDTAPAMQRARSDPCLSRSISIHLDPPTCGAWPVGAAAGAPAARAGTFGWRLSLGWANLEVGDLEVCLVLARDGAHRALRQQRRLGQRRLGQRRPFPYGVRLGRRLERHLPSSERRLEHSLQAATRSWDGARDGARARARADYSDARGAGTGRGEVALPAAWRAWHDDR